MHVVMLMYNLIEYSDKKYQTFMQYYRDEPNDNKTESESIIQIQD